jgi:hypothetical protein
MDLKIYYQKIREVEEGIREGDVVVVSVETDDGGKPGVRTEVPRRLAARMVVEGKARLATAKEGKEHREQQAEAQRLADEAMALSKVQLSVVPTADLNRLKAAAKPDKD